MALRPAPPPPMPREVSASFVPPVDIVAEMKVQTAAFDASVGQTEGGAISLVLKSGTNQFHGTAYYNKLAPELNANLFFANRQGQPIAPLEYNRWGVRPPVRSCFPKLYNGHNRTFYMYGYEGIIETRTRGGVNTVPTAAQRDGDLSDLLRLERELPDLRSVHPARGRRRPFPARLRFRATSFPRPHQSDRHQHPEVLRAAEYHGHGRMAATT